MTTETRQLQPGVGARSRTIGSFLATCLGLILLPGLLFAREGSPAGQSCSQGGFVPGSNCALIGGNIYSGADDGLGPIYAPNPLTPAITDAKVMVQNQHSGGAFITYGTVEDSTWTAVVPAPGDYVVMFCAPGHDATSREFRVEEDDVLYEDVYLPPLYMDPDRTPSLDELPLANLLVFSFYDDAVNGEPDDFPDDSPLNGVTWTAMSEEGDTLAMGVTGSQPIITLPDGSQITETAGYYYFQGLPPGEVIVGSDPNQTWLWPQEPKFSFDATTEFYLMSSEEGGHFWDPKLYPGDPGTEAGAYLLWHGYIEKVGQLPPDTTGTAGTIHGWLVDADNGTEVDEPFPDTTVCMDHPGVTPNIYVPNGFVVLFAFMETAPIKAMATVEANPITGEFTFLNVPPGRYKIFCSDLPIDYVWVQEEVTVDTNEYVEAGTLLPNPGPYGPDPLPSILVPRFGARARGYVKDTDGTPIENAEVHLRYKDGSIQKTEYTNSDGWYNFEFLPEIEVMGYVDVDLVNSGGCGLTLEGQCIERLPLPPYRGATVVDTFWPGGTAMSCSLYVPPITVEANAMCRYIQWYTANYRADFILEPILGTEFDIGGFVYNDHLAKGTWVGDGTYDRHEERTWGGVKIRLYDNTMTLIDSTLSGAFDKSATLAQGWHAPYTMPRDEWGGVFDGPLPGFYEFARLDPADGPFVVEMVALDGFYPNPAGSHLQLVAADPGGRVEVNFGISTLVPLAGEIEGGVFDDLFVDPRTTSLLYEEKAGIDHVPVGVYDHLGYRLGWGEMGNAMCYAGSPIGNCPADEDSIQKPEMERRFAPGVHIYLGNDPTLAGYDAAYLPLVMPYTFGQGKYKFEADWSLVPVGFGGLGGPMHPGQIVPDNAPVITGLQNAASMGGGGGIAGVTRINGNNFGDRQGWASATLNGEKLPILEWTDTSIKVLRPWKGFSGTLLVTTSTGVSNAKSLQVTTAPVWTQYYADRTVYVDGGVGGLQDGSKANPYATVSEALDNLPPLTPRYVVVGPGTYHENIQITESDVYLIGSGPDQTILDGLPDLSEANPPIPQGQGVVGYGPVIWIGDGEFGSVENVRISGFTITHGTVKDDIGAGIFADYGNSNIDINSNVISNNGGYYGGGIWLHRSNHDVEIWNNIIAENGNFGGYGGGISVNDEPDMYEEEHGEPEHVWDDSLAGPPPGTYNIYNNTVFHNFSPDMGGGISLYEVKDELNLYGNVIMENFAEDHGGGMFFEDTGPINLYGNVLLRNFCFDDGGAISFEDVGDTLSHIKIYNNVFAENMADDHGENRARGAALAFDDTFYGQVYNNTIVGNIVTGSRLPAGGAIDSERNGHEYNGSCPECYDYEPGYSDPMIYNNLIWDNWKLDYDQPTNTEEEDADYTWGVNYVWALDQLHVDNPHLQEEWQSHNNSESFTHVENNVIQGGYASGPDNLDIDPAFADPANLDWRVQAASPAIGHAPSATSPRRDLQRLRRIISGGMVDAGAYEWRIAPLDVVRIPAGILGAIQVPEPGTPFLGGTGSKVADRTDSQPKENSSSPVRMGSKTADRTDSQPEGSSSDRARMRSGTKAKRMVRGR